jgi:predicted dehydrogenase
VTTTAKKLNVGIIGLGHLHPRSYMPQFKAVGVTEVVAVTEPDTALRDQFCQDFGLRGYGTVAEMIEQENLDVAAIFLPHVDCPAAAVECAARKINLMVEKPMAASVAGAAQIVRAARRAQVKLTTGYCWRLHPVAREFKRLIDEGVIGRIVDAEGRCAAGRLTRYLDGHAPWMLQRRLSGGGPMYNLGVHWIDLFRWMFNDEVVEVSGQNVKVNTQYDIEDNSFAHLRFSKGPIVALDISYTVPAAYPHGRDLFLAVRGTQGVISWSPAYEGGKDALVICSDHPRFAGSPNVVREFELEPTPGYSGYMGREYVRTFAAAVQHGMEPPITGEDGLAALQVVEAVYRSHAAKRWVPVRKSSSKERVRHEPEHHVGGHRLHRR